MLALLVTGVFYTLYTSNTNSLVQLAAPGYLQGRIAGLYSYIFAGTSSFGSLLAGALADHGGTQLAFVVAGGTALAMAMLGLALRWPTLVSNQKPQAGKQPDTDLYDR